jgi:DNA-binding transcriptional LysR family regulator
MDPRRLELLLELSRRGSMREVADALHLTTSTVSQQLAVLTREAGTPLLEPAGRRVRLTPAGRRLADHAVTVLAALEAARADLDPTAAPRGEVRVAAFATAVRRSLLPVSRVLLAEHPEVRLVISEHEPSEAYELLAADDVDLALTYDYNLAPATFDRTVTARPLWEVPWWVGAPAGTDPAGTSLEVFDRLRDRDWIVNSRNTADEDAVCTIASLAGFSPRVVHRADSLDLVQQLVGEGFGVGLLPSDQPVREGVTLLPLSDPAVHLRAYACTRRGRDDWPPLALLLRLLTPPPPAR